MGTALSKIGFYRKNKSVLMVGLPGSGKTTLNAWIHQNHGNEPLIGFAFESSKYKNATISCFDFPIAEKIKPLLKSFLYQKDALIVTLDSSLSEDFDLLVRDLNWVIQQTETESVPILLVLTKTDLPKSETSLSEERLDRIREIINTNNRKWMQIETNLHFFSNVTKGLDWIANL